MHNEHAGLWPLVRVPAITLAPLRPTITCYGLSLIGEALRRRKHPCARSRSLRSHSSPCPYQLSERMRRAHGAPSMVVGEVAELTVVSIRSNNVRPHVQAMADFAGLIYSQHTAPLAQHTATQENREGVIGATIRKHSADSATGGHRQPSQLFKQQVCGRHSPTDVCNQRKRTFKQEKRGLLPSLGVPGRCDTRGRP
jgi:hypothetical protein